MPPEAEPLSAVHSLGRTRQLQLVALAAAVLFAGWGLVGLVRYVATPTAAAEPAPPPPGTFRATTAQLATMKIATVRAGDAAGLLQATGTISVDEERSTPVVLPFSGQIANVLVQAG